MTRRSRIAITWILAGVGMLCHPARGVAQVVPGNGAAIGSARADEQRVRQLTGESIGPPDSTSRHIRVVAPRLLVRWNSAIPFEGNDGALWAGRGVSGSIVGGVLATYEHGSIKTEFAMLPELTHAENLPFQFLPGRAAGRSAFSSPFHIGTSSADIPLRFGDDRINVVGFGQSAITLTADRVSVGVSAANEWWGPAIRNTLVLSNNAAGIPRIFVRSARPLASRFGAADIRLIAGELTESPFFDRIASNDARSVSGMLLTFRPAADTELTVGLSRLVVAPLASGEKFTSHALDVLTKWEPVRSPDDTLADGRSTQHTDQIFSLFARWIFPASGLELYGEWARTELPRSLGEFMEAPQSTQAYTFGGQYVKPALGRGKVRLQAEATNLEQTIVWPDRPTVDYYAGRAALQGLTQRGQVLGAEIGPGASSQYLAGDWLAPTWSAGLFVSRTRNEEDALYRQFIPISTRHDVTLATGLRGGGRTRHAYLSAELVASQRLNYLFQSNFYQGNPKVATDISNVSLTFRIDPRL
jgi:hypothetical protein